MTRVSITRSIQVRDPSVLPAWRAGMAQWEWKELAGTSLSLVPVVNPLDGVTMQYPAGRIDAWNGFAADRSNGDVYLARAGGHADWPGNEVYKISFSADAPAWSIIRQPTVVPYMDIYQSYYKDGRPASTHHYYALHHCAQRNRLFTYYSGSLWGSGNEANDFVDGFRLSDNDWDAAGTWESCPPGGTASDRPMCQDPRNSDIYTQTGGRYRRWRQSDASWVELGPIASGAGNDINGAAASAVDTTRERVLFSRDLYRVAELQATLLDLVTGLASRITLSGSAAATVVGTGGCGMEYDAALDKFLLKMRTGADLIGIDPASFEAAPIATTGGALMPNSVNGLYTRFKHLPSLGGYIYMPSHASNFWFLATE